MPVTETRTDETKKTNENASIVRLTERMSRAPKYWETTVAAPEPMPMISEISVR
jgi:hypothetical protein